MKKINIIANIILCSSLFINNIKAEEITDITNDAKIKYKWYIEEKTDGKYYPKKDKLEGYLEDLNLIQYGRETIWDQKYCNYPAENYIIETNKSIEYYRVQNVKYVKLEDIQLEKIKDIKIFNNNKLIEYEIIENNEEGIKLELPKDFHVEDIHFYIDTDNKYTIRLSSYKNFLLEGLSKTIENKKILIPDKTWITEDTSYIIETTGIDIEENEFIKTKRTDILCRVKEKKTYRYKINKKYYDNNYYSYIENYIPDTTDYIIEYIGELPTNTVEITKTIKEKDIQKEYIYIDNQENEQIEEKEEKEPENNEEPITKIEYIEKETIKKIYKIPKRVYIIIFSLITLIIINLINIIRLKHSKKKVD